MYKIKIEGNLSKWQVVRQNTKKDYKKVARELYKKYFAGEKKRVFVYEKDELIYTYNGHDNTVKEVT